MNISQFAALIVQILTLLATLTPGGSEAAAVEAWLLKFVGFFAAPAPSPAPTAANHPELAAMLASLPAEPRTPEKMDAWAKALPKPAK